MSELIQPGANDDRSGGSDLNGGPRPRGIGTLGQRLNGSSTASDPRREGPSSASAANEDHGSEPPRVDGGREVPDTVQAPAAPQVTPGASSPIVPLRPSGAEVGDAARPGQDRDSRRDPAFIGKAVWDLVLRNDSGHVRPGWKAAIHVAAACLPLVLYLVLTGGPEHHSGSTSTANPVPSGAAVATAQGGPTSAPAATNGAPVAPAGPTAPAPATVTPGPSGRSSSPLALPPADPSAPPAEPVALLRGGTLVLRGSVPSAELAKAYAARLANLVGKDRLTMEMTLDPRVSGDQAVITIDEHFPLPMGSVVYDDFHDLLAFGALALDLFPESTLVVTGHTDSVGDEPANQALSYARASVVADFLVRGGIDPARIQARGVGGSEPIADDSTPEGREANRRIQATLIGVRPSAS